MNLLAGGGGRCGPLLGLLAVLCVLVLPTGARAEAPEPTPTVPTADPSDTATPAAERPAAACEARPSFEHQVVECRARGLVPGGAVVLRVLLDPTVAAAPAEWVGGVRVDDDGTAEADVAVPCGTAGEATTELSGPLADGGRFRHRVALDLTGDCSASPLVPPDAWAAAASLLVGASALVVGLGAWRHVTRRRRVTGSTGPRGRVPRGRGRRRPPRRRKRRPSRARRRRRRRR